MARVSPNNRGTLPSQLYSSTLKNHSLLGVAFGPTMGLLFICLFLAALNSLLSTGMNQIFHCIPISIVLWLTSHLVPLTISNIPVSFLPLLPALGVIIWVKILSRRACNNTSITGDPRLVTLVATLSPGVIAVALLVVLKMTLEGFPLDIPSVPLTVSSITFLHAVGSIWGAACSQRGINLLIPSAIRKLRIYDATKLAIKMSTSMFKQWIVIFGLIVIILITAHWKEWVQLGSSNPLNMFPLWLLSIGYIPNVMAFTLGFSLLQTVHVGQAAINIVTVTTDNRLPAIPLIALIPHSPRQEWIAFPLGIAIYALFCGILLARLSSSYTTILINSIHITVLSSIVLFLSGGEIGFLGAVNVSIAFSAITCLATFAIIGSITALILRYSIDIYQLTRLRIDHHHINKIGKKNYSSEIISTQELEQTFQFNDDLTDDPAIEYAMEYFPSGPITSESTTS